MLVLLLLTACSWPEQPSRSQHSSTNDLPSRLETLAPDYLDWFTEVENRLLERGRPLSSEETEMAEELSVQRPERVRVVVSREFPLPEDRALRAEAKRLGFDTLPEGGRAMGYAVLLKPGEAGSRSTLAHELVHVAQMERMGREAFLRRYFAELDRFGYTGSPLEREAQAAGLRFHR